MLLSAFVIALALFTGACGATAAQKTAYERAAKAEQSFSAETAPAIITGYRDVIQLDPGSEWAKKAQVRIEAIEAQIKAEEVRKSVFQEHGID